MKTPAVGLLVFTLWSLGTSSLRGDAMFVVSQSPGGWHAGTARSWTLQETEQVTAPSVSAYIVSSRYCRGDGEVNVLHLTVDVSIVNQADTPVIMYMGGPLVTSVRVARDRAMLEAERYEQSFSPTWISEAGSFSDRPAIDRFVTIKRGLPYTFRYEGVIALFVAAEPDSVAMDGILSAGRHVLAVVLGTWALSDSAADQWRRRLSGQGVLWTKSFEVEPVDFTVARNPALETCE